MTSLFFDDVIKICLKYSIFLEKRSNFQMSIKNVLKQLFKFCFWIMQAKRQLYNISDGFCLFRKEKDKKSPKFQEKSRFSKNRFKIGKSGFPGIFFPGINLYYPLKHVCKVSCSDYLYLRSYLEFSFCKNKGIFPFSVQVVSDYSQKFNF